MKNKPLAPILGFLVFSHGWTWLFWALSAIWGRSVWEAPGVYFFYIGGAGVFLGGVVMTSWMGGRPGLKDLWLRLSDARRVGARGWALVLGFFPALALVSAATAYALGLSAEPLDWSEARRLFEHPVELLAFAFFVLLIGPLPEEIGWRGYLLDRLQSRSSALGASLGLALVWWTWHLPLFVLPGYFAAFGNETPSLGSFALGIASVVIIYTWVYNHTNRSVLAVIVFHFLQNLTGEMIGLSGEADVLRTILMLAFSAVLARFPGRLRI